MQDTRRLDETEIRAGLKRIGIPDFEMEAAVQSFHKWEDDRIAIQDHRAVKFMCRGRKWRRMM